jgi:hypothetical protein
MLIWHGIAIADPSEKRSEIKMFFDMICPTVEFPIKPPRYGL